MDLDESILQNQYILDDMEKEPIKYIYCIVLDDSGFWFISRLSDEVKIEYDFLECSNIIKNYKIGKIDLRYFDYTNFEKSYKYFEEI